MDRRTLVPRRTDYEALETRHDHYPLRNPKSRSRLSTDRQLVPRGSDTNIRIFLMLQLEVFSEPGVSQACCSRQMRPSQRTTDIGCPVNCPDFLNLQ
ncbi:hypothetical protein CDD80_4476 [Ophiocordyceps camponoti-rufipedis]|uniref:Uncharacterized protein n=1 Tax=Ophiocordyceps camponoti-rufipedis TaxID=2004952 RepID=A0A2C5YZQ0_9HYPO|nr:hypothetical protein CDD80_4476 [Ophiocordyceps camponoti-rufipedis]